MKLDLREVLGVPELLLLLRGLADQLEDTRSLTVQGLQFPIAEQVTVRLGFTRVQERDEVALLLSLQWTGGGEPRQVVDEAAAGSVAAGSVAAKSVAPGSAAGAEPEPPRPSEPPRLSTLELLEWLHGGCAPQTAALVEPGPAGATEPRPEPDLDETATADGAAPWPDAVDGEDEDEAVVLRLELSEAETTGTGAGPEASAAPASPSQATSEPAPPGLLAWGRRAAERLALASELGVSPDELLALLRREELMRLEGLGPVEAELLLAAGVGDVEELAARSIAELAAATGLAEPLLAGWISGAQGLGRLLEP